LQDFVFYSFGIHVFIFIGVIWDNSMIFILLGTEGLSSYVYNYIKYHVLSFFIKSLAFFTIYNV